MAVYLTPPPRGPLAQAVAAVVAVVVVAVGLVLGLAALAIVAGLGIVLGLVVWIRGWYLGRKTQGGEDQRSGRTTQGSTIDAEYTVISSRSNDSEAD